VCCVNSNTSMGYLSLAFLLAKDFLFRSPFGGKTNLVRNSPIQRGLVLVFRYYTTETA
jgi:hypothetical protein